MLETKEAVEESALDRFLRVVAVWSTHPQNLKILKFFEGGEFTTNQQARGPRGPTRSDSTNRADLRICGSFGGTMTDGKM